MTVANKDKSGARGKICNISVMFEKLQAGFDLIILDNVPLEVVIGRLT